MRQAAVGLALFMAVQYGTAVPAVGEQEEFQVFRVELETEASKDRESNRDYYISGGKANGIRESMILNVFRPKTIRDYDRAEDHNIKVFVGQLRVMKTFDQVAVARIVIDAYRRRINQIVNAVQSVRGFAVLLVRLEADQYAMPFSNHGRFG